MVLTGVGAGTYELQIMASSVVPTMVRIQVAEQEHMIAVQPGFARYAVPLTVPMRWQDTVTPSMMCASYHRALSGPHGLRGC